MKLPLLILISFLAVACAHHQRTPAAEQAEDNLKIEWPEVSEFSNFEISQRIERLEQVCIQGNGVEGQMIYARLVRSRMEQYSDLLDQRLRTVGFENVDLRDLKNENSKKATILKFKLADWQKLGDWKKNFTNTEAGLGRCELLETAWVNALLRLQVLEPSKPICSFRDILCENLKEKEYQNDLARAFWELRYFDQSLRPSNLKVFSRGEGVCNEKSLWEKAKTRIEFLKDRKIPRRPLGYAIGMCGRSMTAHYLDDAVVNEKTKEPLGWSKFIDAEKSLEDIKELILNLEENVP